MTIPTPTSESLTAGLARSPGLPDLSALNRLAGELFAQVVGVPVSGLTQGTTTGPTAGLAGSLPIRAPGTSSLELGTAPSSEATTLGAHSTTSSKTSSEPARTTTSTTTSEPAVEPWRADALQTWPEEDRTIAQSFGLPGQSELQALVAALEPRHEAILPGSNQGGFYFVRPEQVLAHARRAGAPQLQPRAVPGSFDVEAVRRDFPILQERVNGKPLVWLDNAATTHKPRQVIERLTYFYEHENSNIHRAAHELAARATDAYEGARQTVARFLGAATSEEIIFVRGATEGINLVAKSWGAKHIGEGDEIIVSHLEHHANIVPWQQLAAEKGARLRVIPVDDSGQVLLDEYRKLLGPRTRLVAVTQVSNALGTIVPVQQIVALAKAAGARTLVDGAQSISHLPVNVQALGADFFVFSGHKVFAPTGIGVVWGRREVLEETPPWQGGGNMIEDVTFERTRYQGPPARFEAGTGNIADAVGLGAALEYLQSLGVPNVARYEHDLLEYATERLRSIPGLRLIGTALEKTSVISFVLSGREPADVGRALNEEGIAVRSGHHCAQPILRRFGVEATVRPSLAFYNTCAEIDHLAAVVGRIARRG